MPDRLLFQIRQHIVADGKDSGIARGHHPPADVFDAALGSTTRSWAGIVVGQIVLYLRSDQPQESRVPIGGMVEIPMNDLNGMTIE